MSFLHKLDQLPAFHHMVRLLHLRQAAGLALRWFPRVRRLPGSNATYRCRYLETLLLADEILNRNVYLKAINPSTLTTFADLGSNVGLFAVLLKHLTGKNDLEGLMVDANPQMVEETQWHLKTNAMHKVHALFGLVGNAQSGQSTDFYLLPSNLGSSQFPVYEPGKPPKGKWKKVSVPQLSLEEDWLKCVGDKRCDLLKVDIEGSEGELLKNETKFLERVDSIILEWHKWIVTENEIQSLLDLQGFERVELLEELEGTGIAWYRRSK